jgi:hypothetical protein
VRASALSQAKYLKVQPLLAGWIGFAVIAPVAMTASWLAGCIVLASFLPYRGVLGECFLTVAFYPVLAFVFARLGRGDLSED